MSDPRRLVGTGEGAASVTSAERSEECCHWRCKFSASGDRTKVGWHYGSSNFSPQSHCQPQGVQSDVHQGCASSFIRDFRRFFGLRCRRTSVPPLPRGLHRSWSNSAPRSRSQGRSQTRTGISAFHLTFMAIVGSAIPGSRLRFANVPVGPIVLPSVVRRGRDGRGALDCEPRSDGHRCGR